MIELRTLGTVELTSSEGSPYPTVLSQPRRTALLCYLALASPAPPAFHRRDTLFALFWPEHGTEQARHALRQSLYFLRRQLGPHVIASRGDEELGLAPDRFRCDGWEFERAVSEGRLEEALALYRGELLPGFHISEAPEFERWLEEARVRWAERAREVAWLLAEREEASGRVADAVPWARRAVALSPYDEPGVRRLIGLLDRAGSAAEAVRVYEQFAQRLWGDLELEPSAETRTAVDGVRARPTPVEHPTAGMPAEPAPGAAPLETAPGIRPASRDASRAPRWVTIAFVGAAVAATAAAGVTRLVNRGPPPVNAARVVVAVPENKTGDPALDPLGEMAADYVARGLVETQLVDVIEARVALGSGSAAASRTLSAVHDLARDVGASRLLSGSYYHQNDSLRFELRITDAASGRVLTPVLPVTGLLADPAGTVELLRQRIMVSFALQFDARFADFQEASRPATYEAYQEFLAGDAAQYRAGWMFADRPGVKEALREALGHYQRAFALDSMFTLPLVHVAEIYSYVEPIADRCERTDSIAAILSPRLGRLPTYDRAVLDWAVASCRGDRAGALDAARRGLQAAPRSERLAAHAAHLARLAYRPREAIAILGRFDPERGWFRQVPEAYWFEITNDYHLLGDHGRELVAARQARRQAPEDLLILELEVRALAALGRDAELEEVLEERLRQQSHLARDFPTGALMAWAAAELRAHGHLPASKGVAERAVAWYRSRPAAEQVPAVWPGSRWSLAEALYIAERYEEARGLYAQLAEEQNDLADRETRWNLLAIRGQLGKLAARRGDLRETARIEQWLAGLQAPYERGLPTYYRAALAAAAGEGERTVALARLAIDQGFPLLHWWTHNSAFEQLRDYPAFAELLRPRG